MSGDFWKSTVSGVAAPLTREAFDAAVKAVEAQVHVPHGSADNPHICHPKPHVFTVDEHDYVLCLECGPVPAEWHPMLRETS